MCPDDRILSMFYDDQLSGQERARVLDHASGCSRCGNIISGYERISAFLVSQPLPDFSAGRERIRKAVFRRPPKPSPLALFSRKISVPIPIAAAAVAALIVLLIGIGVLDDFNAAPGVVAAIVPGPLTDVQNIQNVRDLDELLQALADQNGLREMTIELPEAHGYSLRGEPQFLREAEVPEWSTP